MAHTLSQAVPISEDFASNKRGEGSIRRNFEMDSTRSFCIHASLLNAMYAHKRESNPNITHA